MELIDLSILSNKFTWCLSSGSCRSRLDRFLILQRLINLWNIKAQYVGDKDISDHRPIWIKANITNWGPKLFKVFDCWYKHPGFVEFVKNEWNYIVIEGDVAHVLKEKLKHLRNGL
ncbi:unnamed protein product [Lathyrus sativus]|nr:unnamed protein product [Lathyrus sativus]